MKRRLKLTPFAKIFFLFLFVLGVRYVYLHKDDLSEKSFFQMSDTVPPEKKDTIQLSLPDAADTIVFYLENKDSLLQFRVDNKSIHLRSDSSGFFPDTLIFNVSESKNIKGKLIIK